MGLFGRPDGTKIKVDSFKKLEPYAMVKRMEGIVYHTPQYDLTKTLPFIKEYNKQHGLSKENGDRLTLFHIFVAMATRCIALHPEVNRFIEGRKFWQRNEISLSFVVKKELTYDSEETFAKLRFSPFDTLETVRQKVYDYVNKARSDEKTDTKGEQDFFGKLPRFILLPAIKILKLLDFYGLMPKSLIHSDPLYVSAVLANLGSVGLEGNIIHHAYEWGNAPVFLAINRIRKAPLVNQKTNEIEIRDIVDVGIAFDERITEGFRIAYTLKDMKKYVENPELLLEMPDISEETLEELKLKGLEDDPLYQEYLTKRKDKSA